MSPRQVDLFVELVEPREPDELAASPAVECEHARILHETRTRAVCRACGATMQRHAGDWRAQR